MASPAPNYAEFENSSPEVVPQPPPPVSISYKTAYGTDPIPVENTVPNWTHEPAGQQRRRRVFGLAPLTAIILLLVAIVIIVGVTLGAVLGTKHKTSAVGSASPSSVPTSTTSSTPSPTSLAIIQAVYAGIDDTQLAKTSMQQGGDIVVNMSPLTPFSAPDPWPNNKKCLALLHSFGSSIRTFVACDADGPFTLLPGQVSLSPNTTEITRQGPSSPSFSIVSVVWGAAEIRDEAVYQSLYQYKLNQSAVPFNNNLFGRDTLPNWYKSAVIWYTEDNFQTFKAIFGRENDQVPF